MNHPPDQALSISVAEAVDGVTVVTLVGDLDMTSADEFLSALGRLAQGASVVVDVSGLVFIDSSGLNALVVGTRAVDSRDGRVVVADASEHIARVFEVVQLAESVTVEASVAEARRRLERDASTKQVGG